MESKLKIAFISYEYPPDTSGGGIGTYTRQIAKLLHANGHSVTVFCGTSDKDYNSQDEGVEIRRIRSADVDEFRKNIPATFRKEHRTIPFDVMESPEYGAGGLLIKQEFPELPYIVNLHTPTYVLREFNDYFRQFLLPSRYILRLKIAIKSLLKLPHYPFYTKNEDIEYLNIQSADSIISPSKALADKISKDWKISRDKIEIVPNPYFPGRMMLDIPTVYSYNRVTFIGKMSILKGMLDFKETIKIVLDNNPQVRFRFIGEDSFSPDPAKTMKEFILSDLPAYHNSLEFTGKVPLHDIPRYLAETDIVVCNSLWENYPTVVLEAMSAARIVIGTDTGGIPEIISDGVNGIIIPVKQPDKLAAKINWVYRNPDVAKELGINARISVTRIPAESEYKTIESKYLTAIQKSTNR